VSAPEPAEDTVRIVRGGSKATAMRAAILDAIAHERNEREAARLRALFDRPPGPEPMAMQISMAEQAHHDVLRQRSYHLAIQRGHIRR
jgi:hypothetical protein